MTTPNDISKCFYPECSCGDCCSCVPKRGLAYGWLALAAVAASWLLCLGAFYLALIVVGG